MAGPTRAGANWRHDLHAGNEGHGSTLFDILRIDRPGGQESQDEPLVVLD